jgi:hypothetical protein
MLPEVYERRISSSSFAADVSWKWGIDRSEEKRKDD